MTRANQVKAKAVVVEAVVELVVGVEAEAIAKLVIGAEAEVVARLGATEERTKMTNQQDHQRGHHQRLGKVGELNEGKRENCVELPPLLHWTEVLAQ